MEATVKLRKERMKELRSALCKLTVDERQALAERYGVVTIEGRQLSINNQCLLAMQMGNPTIVGGFQQWKKAGRVVRKGEHGAIIWFPSGKKSEEQVQDDEIEMHFFTGVVFDITQTDELVKE